MARRPFVAGNWKMNTTETEARDLAAAVVEATTEASADIALCVPLPHLAAVREVLRNTSVGLGAQNVHWEPKGAFTGEVSTAMLADYCQYVIIGHSERRQLFGDSDDWVRRKLEAVLASPLDPILCVGETLAERNDGETINVLKRQLHSAFDGVPLAPRITVAYEPIWAIGTGETATPDAAQEACQFVRAYLRQLGGDPADRIRIQYGGSVTPQNAAELLSQPDIDGALVGGASLRADQFAAIVAAARAG